jgi:hypothetical protein
MNDINQELKGIEQPAHTPLKPLYRYTYSSGFFQNSISPKKLVDDKLRFSIHRRMYRIKKGVEECKGFLTKSKFKPMGFKGGKISA